MKHIKYSDILIEAKRHLLKGKRNHRNYKSPYICDAIAKAADEIDTTEAIMKGKILRNKIQDAIGDHFSIYEWLAWDAKVPIKQMTDIEVQKYRHRLLDHMIKMYKEEGQ